MANEKKIDQVILGLLSHTDMTGYEIKKRMDTTLSYFWSGSYGSIYPALKTMEANGLVTSHSYSQNGRDKISYSITQSGRDTLSDWLKRPATRDELHYETLLKLFFAGEGSPSQALAHIAAFQARTEEGLPYLTRSVESLRAIQDNPAHMYYMLTAMFGEKIYNAYLEWCEEATSMIQEYEKKTQNSD